MIEGWFFLQNFHTVRQEVRSHTLRVRKNAAPMTVSDIQPWMTFDYLNFVFHLPQGYLQNALGIPNSQAARYSSVGTYVEKQNLTREAFLAKISSILASSPKVTQ